MTPTAPDTPNADGAVQAIAPSVSLSVTAGGTPQAGKFFEDIGHFAIRGGTAPARASQRVEIYWYTLAPGGGPRS